MNFTFRRNLAALEWAAMSVFLIVLFQNCSNSGGLPSNITENRSTSEETCTTCTIEIKQEPESTELYEGGDVILEIEASSSKAITYQWHKDGVDLPGEDKDILILRNTIPDQSGNYGVTLSNGVVVEKSQVANVKINVAPENAIAPVINREPSSKNVEVGQKLELSVQAAGYPNPTYQWFKDGAPISGEVGPVLTVFKAEYANTGTYSVEATNVGGSVQSQDVEVQVLTTAGIFAQDLYYRDTGGSFALGRAGATGKVQCDPGDKVVSVINTSCAGSIEVNEGGGDTSQHLKDSASIKMLDNGNSVQVKCETWSQNYVNGYAKILCLKSTSSFYDFFYHRGQSLTSNIKSTTPEAEFYCQDGDATLGFTHINCETNDRQSSRDDDRIIESAIKRVLYNPDNDRLTLRCQYDNPRLTKGGFGHLGCMQEPSLVGDDLYDVFSNNASKTPTTNDLANRRVQCETDDMLIGVIEAACDGYQNFSEREDSYDRAWALNRIEVDATNRVTVHCRTKSTNERNGFGFARIRCLRKVGTP